MSAHIARYIEDDKGDLIDLVYTCSDSCHHQYCRDTGTPYEGWNGCHEISFSTVCASCETRIERVNEDD